MEEGLAAVRPERRHLRNEARDVVGAPAAYLLVEGVAVLVPVIASVLVEMEAADSVVALVADRVHGDNKTHKRVLGASRSKDATPCWSCCVPTSEPFGRC